MKLQTKQWLGIVAVSVLSSALTLQGYRLLSHSNMARVDEDGFSRPVSFASYSAAPLPPTDFTVAAENSVHAVVHIKSTSMKQVQMNGQSDIFEFFFGAPQRQMQAQPRVGFGSGVIVSSDGYIVTNNHVIAEADEIEVKMNNNKIYKAKLVGADPNTDIALLKIEEKDLPVVPFGDSDKLKIGEWVLAVGNPFNLTSTVTAGIVSAKARNIGILDQPGSNMKIESFIQTDAAVNPGNSGGALVNVRGELVGINTAIASNTGNYAGYSFAVPISIVSKVVADLKQYGAVQRALLGVSPKGLDSELAKLKNLSVTEGVYIESVGERSAAAEAGIKAGDVIISVNGTNVKSPSELQEQVVRYRPGDKVKVVVMRGKEQMSFAVVLKNKNGSTSLVKEKAGLEVLGAAFKELPKELKQQFGIDYGVQVSGLMKGKFSDAGMRKGFIILRINDQKVSAIEEVEQIANRIMSGNTSDQAMFISGIYPNGKTSFYAIDLSE